MLCKEMDYKHASLATIVICECAAIFILTGFVIQLVQQQKRDRNGYISRVQKSALIFPKDSQFSSFYEPVPNTIQTMQFPWATGSAVYTLNADGLNERFNYEEKKATDAARIVVLGDSFTFGQYINTKDNWTELLEDKLNKDLVCDTIKKFEVINLGVLGYDIEYAAHRYDIRGKKYTPDRIVWYLIWNDFIEVDELLSPFTKRWKELIAPQERMEAGSHGDYWPEFTKAREEYEKTYSKEMIYNYIHAVLQKFSFSGSQLLIVADESVTRQSKNFLRGWAKGRGDQVQLTNMEHLSYLPDRHPDQESQTKIANNLFRFLQKSDFSTCSLRQ